MSDDMHMMLGPDGKVAEVDLGPVLRRHRAAHVKARAGAIEEAAALFADDAFDPESTWDAGKVAGLPDAALAAAAHVGSVLWTIEHGTDAG